MKKSTWKKHHKWLGLVFCFFMLMFCMSGIVLNHRASVSDIDVGRKWLPERYRYARWNGGLLRGTVPYAGADSVPRVLIYGAGGVWCTDSMAATITDFSDGLPAGADYRQIRSIAHTADGELFAVSALGLYRLAPEDGGWKSVRLPKEEDEMLSDIACHKDTLVVAGRSCLYLSVAPYISFRKIRLKAPEGYKAEVSLFRAVWMMHSGELFGTAGRLAADMIAAVLIILCITGLLYCFFLRYMRRERLRGRRTPKSLRVTRASYRWHDRLGRATIVLTLFITLTGWCLRPPVLVLLALNKVPAFSGTRLDSPNPWNDRLRMIRYDVDYEDWLLSASDGFYSLKSLDARPVRINRTPPVSVMGLNVFQKSPTGEWLCGSFSGMFVWDRRRNTITDYFTQQPAHDRQGPPFGDRAISGYSNDLTSKEITVEYYVGTNAISQPAEFEILPMPLWNLALEVHSGRIYMGVSATYVFIFFAGIGAVWCLLSGWKISKNKG